MALPDDGPSTTPVIADYIAPYDRFTGPLEDYEEGGIALNDGTLGLQVQMWYLSYNDIEDDPNYGDFTVTAEDTLESAVIINVAGVKRVGLGFNQNNDPFICYETVNCEAKLYWYDLVPQDYVTTTLPAGSRWVACCLDDHRQTQTGTSYVILGYIRNGTLYYRQERDRFATEYSMGTVGAAILYKVGMTKNLRLKFDVREGRGQRLSEIQGDVFSLVGLPANNFNVADLYPIWVRGFIVADVYSAADISRVLQRDYFYDLPQVDYKLEAILRGGPNVATIAQSECVLQEDVSVETAREQGLEYPRKVHYVRNPAETDYTPTKVTSERRSPDIRAVSEITVDSALNLTTDDAAQVADKIHKAAWNDVDLKATFGLPEDYARLIPSNPISFEVRPNVYKRVRITKFDFEDGYFKVEATLDRASSYISGATGYVPVPGDTPALTLPGVTTWEFMDLPALTTTHDTLRYYVVGRGDVDTGWHGAQLQREVGVEWQKEGDIPSAETMGLVEEALPTASPYFIDTTNTLLVSLNIAPTAYTTDLLLAGKGAWLVGDEIIQVRDWVAEGANWRGSYMFRGRLDTPTALHSIGARVVFLGNPISIAVDGALLDTILQLRAASYDSIADDATDAPYTFIGRSQEEWPPEDLTSNLNGNDWEFSWVPRHHLGNSANPIPSVNFYAWQFRFTAGGNTYTRTTLTTLPAFIYTSAMQVADFGSNQASFTNVELRALNYLGGEGKSLNEAVP